MTQSLRKTPSQLHLTYRSGEAGGRLAGRNFSLLHDGTVLTLSIDLTANLQTRNKSAGPYLDALNLVHRHQELGSLLCGDNLLRARLLKAWEQVLQPQLRMRLELGPRCRYLYAVQPHSLFTGGIQLDVVAVLQEDARASRPLAPQQQDNPRNHP